MEWQPELKLLGECKLVQGKGGVLILMSAAAHYQLGLCLKGVTRQVSSLPKHFNPFDGLGGLTNEYTSPLIDLGWTKRPPFK
jgi:hypothetical protein